MGEIGRTLKKRISEHKQAVRHRDDKNGIAVRAQSMDHRIDWEKASITNHRTVLLEEENSRSSTDSVTPHYHELRLRAISQPLLVTADQATLNNLSSIYLFLSTPLLFLSIHCF